MPDWWIVGRQHHEDAPGSQDSVNRHEHIDAAGHPESHRAPRPQSLADQPGRHLVGAAIEVRCRDLYATVFDDHGVGVGAQQILDRSVYRDSRRLLTRMRRQQGEFVPLRCVHDGAPTDPLVGMRDDRMEDAAEVPREPLAQRHRR